MRSSCSKKIYVLIQDKGFRYDASLKNRLFFSLLEQLNRLIFKIIQIFYIIK